MCGVPAELTYEADESNEDFVKRLTGMRQQRVRVLGAVPTHVRRAAVEAGVHLADQPVTANGRLELLHYLREQAISRTLHRFGNLVAIDVDRPGRMPHDGSPAEESSALLASP